MITDNFGSGVKEEIASQFFHRVFRVADNGLDRGFDSLQSLEESFLNKVTRHRYSIGDSE